MRNHKLHWISGLTLVLSFAAGCAKDDGDATGPSEGTGTEDSGSGETSTAGSMSMSETTASTSMSTSASTMTDSTMTEPSTITVSGSETTGMPDPLPNGEMCDDNEQCISQMCFVVGPLGGICGDCLTDADCDGGGCSIPNPLAMPPEGAECNMGEPGEGCMSDEVCMGDQVCATILDVPGILTASTCSECLDDSGCTDGNLCSPSYDVANLSGVKTCVPPGTVPDGEGCDLEVSGNDACESGFCQPADVLGVLELGVCSGCATDDDCMNGDVCVPPAIDLEAGLVAGGCAPPE